MSNPVINIDPYLEFARFPEYFRVNRGQVGEVMSELADIPAAAIEATTIDFEAGNTGQPPFMKAGKDHFKIYMRGVRRLEISTNPALPEAWQTFCREDDLVTATHLALAGVIGRCKAEIELGLPSNILPLNSAGRVGLAGAVGGVAGYILTSGDYVGTAAGFGLALNIQATRVKRSIRRDWISKADRIMNTFAGDERVPKALKGAIALDYRG